MDLLHDGADAVVVAVTETGDEGEILLFGLLGCGENAADTSGICGHRFLAENVFSRRDRSFKMGRPKTGRRGEDDDVHPAVDDLFVCVETDETFFGGDGDFFSMAGAKIFQAALQAILEGIAHGDERDVVIGAEGLAGCAGAASAAADEADAEGVRVSFGEKVAGENRWSSERAADEGGGFEEFAAAGRVFG